MTKHFNRSLVTDEDILVEKIQNRYFKSSKAILDEENEVACHLLCERKEKIKDDSSADILKDQTRDCPGCTTKISRDGGGGDRDGAGLVVVVMVRSDGV